MDETTKRWVLTAPDVGEKGSQRIEELVAELDELDSFEVRTFGDPPRSVDDWLDRTRNSHGVILGWKMPDEVLRADPTFTAVSFLGTGAADNINLSLCKELGISVHTASGYGDNAVAELAIALLMSAWNNIPSLDRETRSGGWGGSVRRELRGSILGILGYGGIGKRVAELGVALGMNVKVWSRSLAPGDEIPFGVIAPVDEILSTSDAVSVHLALTTETVDFLRARELEKLRPGAILVNTARAGIVNEADLLRLVNAGRIVAALDVFHREPLEADDPILRTNRSVLTPHVGYNTDVAFDELMRQGVAGLIEHFRQNGKF